MRNLLAAALWLAVTPANAMSPDEMRLAIGQNDFAAVSTGLEEEFHKADPEQAGLRDLYKIFIETHPDMAAFTKLWLEQQPDSAFAQTARVWNLYGLGWAMRGNGWANQVSPEAMQRMSDLHIQALELAQEARDAAPKLAPASDAVIVLAGGMSDQGLAESELDRFMSVAPNRGSLLRAAGMLIPQWGGSAQQMLTLCYDHADKITNIEGYTPDICSIDVIFSSNITSNSLLEAARMGLQDTDHPILDYAREKDLLAGFGSAEARLENLTKLKARRSLTPEEADDFDALSYKGTSLTPRIEYPKALHQALQEYRILTDRDPGNGVLVTYYSNLILLLANLEERGVTPDERADVYARMVSLFTYNAENSAGWWALADINSKSIKVTDIGAAEPFHVNAIAYSNHSKEAILHALDQKLFLAHGMAVRPRAGMREGFTQKDMDQLDQFIYCPIIRQLRLLEAVCNAMGQSFQQCSESNSRIAAVQERLNVVAERGACKAERTDPLENLIYLPIPLVEFDPN